MGLEEIGSFVEAAEQGSLTAAAKVLGVPKSTISRRIARLEEELGQELVRRSARSFRLTDAGEVLYQRSAPAVRDLLDASRLFRDGGAAPSGDLRLTIPVELGMSAPFSRLLAAFQETYPEIRVITDVSDRYVDILSEGFDVAVRVHTRPLEDRSTLRARRLGSVPSGLYASTSYLNRAGRPEHPDTLSTHRTVSVSRPVVSERWAMRARHTQDPYVEFPIRPSLLTSALATIPTAIEAGAGIGFLWDLVGDSLVAAGGVERVLPGWELAPATLSLLWPTSRLMSPRLRAFLDFTSGRFLADPHRG